MLASPVILPRPQATSLLKMQLGQPGVEPRISPQANLGKVV